MKIHTILYATLKILVNGAWSVSVARARVWAKYYLSEIRKFSFVQ